MMRSAIVPTKLREQDGELLRHLTLPPQYAGLPCSQRRVRQCFTMQADSHKKESDNSQEYTPEVQCLEINELQKGILFGPWSEWSDVTMHDPVQERMRQSTHQGAHY